ncbi:MAG: hypothetical protein SFU83_08285 [Meiothermus sp.]|nr:hypothetical protein [Meiothermus sp.]
MSPNLKPSPQGAGRLVPLAKTNLRLADPAEDIRGRWVVDSRGFRVGRVAELLADLDERRVSQFEIVCGGLWGWCRRRRLGLDELERIGERQVHLRHPIHRAEGPSYSPKLTVRPEDDPSRFGPFSYSPFWGTGPGCAVSPRPGEPNR